MKAIFLDIDGVLNEEKSRSSCCGYRGIDDKKVEILAKIVKETGARLVLTSTWKNHWRPFYKEFQGFCYTQVSDIQQEVNGLLYADRKPKFTLEKIRDITLNKKSQ